MLYKEEIDLNRIPQHVAIIMDGNGRWAKQRGHERSYGHQAGAETVHIIAEEAARLGVKYLTLYTFSTENWNRPSALQNRMLRQGMQHRVMQRWKGQYMVFMQGKILFIRMEEPERSIRKTA